MTQLVDFSTHTLVGCFSKKPAKVKEAGNKLDLSDLYADPVVMFQHKLDPWINMFFCFVFPTLFGHYVCGETYWVSFLVLGVTRYLAVLHSTWLVNSLAHKVGYKPYDTSINPTENAFVSLFALGEGWHNWHHTYPWDYATSEFGVLKRWNPTKFTIDFFASIGLVWDRKRAVQTWELAKKRMGTRQQEVSAYLSSVKKRMENQQAEIGNILETAKNCFDNQQKELCEILTTTRNNMDLDVIVETMKENIEMQKAEFVTILESAKLAFESQQAEFRNVMEGLPNIRSL